MLSSDRTLRAWRRSARNGLLSEARSMQRMALGYLGILRPLEKLPDPEPTSQVQCLHMEAVSRSNQWCRWLVCRACQLRLSYLPTPQAALQVERRRTLAASRRCRASRASVSSTTAGPATANMAGGSPQAPTGDLSEVVAAVNEVARQLESQSAEFRRLNEALAPEGYLSAYSDVDDGHDWELW